MDDTSTLRIGELAESVGVSTETIRYYERRGLLAAPPRSVAGYRRYTSADVERLALLLRAKGLGFTLAEIHELVGALETGTPHDLVRVVEAKVGSVEQQIAELEATRARLRRLADLCEHGDGAACMQLRLVAS